MPTLWKGAHAVIPEERGEKEEGKEQEMAKEGGKKQEKEEDGGREEKEGRERGREGRGEDDMNTKGILL